MYSTVNYVYYYKAVRKNGKYNNMHKPHRIEIRPGKTVLRRSLNFQQVSLVV